MTYGLEKYLKGQDHTIPAFAWRDKGKPQEISVRKASVLAKVQT
jgi:hypothetical protein